MFNMVMSTSKGSIRLNGDGLSIRQGDTYVYLPPREYRWLPYCYTPGGNLTIESESGTITLLPHIVCALVSMICGIPRR